MVLNVSLRLCFVKLPNLAEERVFKASLSIINVEDCSLQDLMSIIENKVTFMEFSLLQHNITVFFRESSGDRYVVDNSYFTELVNMWAKAATVSGAVEGSEEDEDDEDEKEKVFQTSASFEIEVVSTSNSANTLSQSSVGRQQAGQHGVNGFSDASRADGRGGRATAATQAKPAPLTVENLAKVKSAPVLSEIDARFGEGRQNSAPPSTGVRVRVGDLTAPPVHPQYFLRCVILSTHFKNPKPGLFVAEMDLGDVDAPSSEVITAVTFDELVIKEIREKLRGDMRHVIEIKNAFVKRKTDVEMRYQRNNNHLMLRFDRSCKLEVVQILPKPVTVASSHSYHQNHSSTPIVTVREQLQPSGSGVLDLAEIASNSNVGAAPLIYHPNSSSSTSSGARRTVFTFDAPRNGAPQGRTNATLANETPAERSRRLAQQQLELLKRPRPGDSDVHQREPLLERHTNREERLEERIRKTAPAVSTTCIVCRLDLENKEQTMRQVQFMLEKNVKNGGSQVPTFDVLKKALSDPRPGKEQRLYCSAQFVDKFNRTVNLVHPRCVHTCSEYQKGERLEDVMTLEANLVTCTLCKQLGATIKCYHPQCTENYHVLCALFSNGYVNFGDRDPYLPCAACPKHTDSSEERKKKLTYGADTSCFSDGIVFDSRVVTAEDLRDPDENDGY